VRRDHGLQERQRPSGCRSRAPSVCREGHRISRTAQTSWTSVRRANSVRTSNVPRKCPRVTVVCRFAGDSPSPLTDSNHRPPPTILGQGRDARAPQGHGGHESPANRRDPTQGTDPREDARGRADVRTTFARRDATRTRDLRCDPRASTRTPCLNGTETTARYRSKVVLSFPHVKGRGSAVCASERGMSPERARILSYRPSLESV
jgi:hypothetical protein